MTNTLFDHMKAQHTANGRGWGESPDGQDHGYDLAAGIPGWARIDRLLVEAHAFDHEHANFGGIPAPYLVPHTHPADLTERLNAAIALADARKDETLEQYAARILRETAQKASQQLTTAVYALVENDIEANDILDMAEQAIADASNEGDDA